MEISGGKQIETSSTATIAPAPNNPEDLRGYFDALTERFHALRATSIWHAKDGHEERRFVSVRRILGKPHPSIAQVSIQAAYHRGQPGEPSQIDSLAANWGASPGRSGEDDYVHLQSLETGEPAETGRLLIRLASAMSIAEAAQIEELQTQT